MACGIAAFTDQVGNLCRDDSGFTTTRTGKNQARAGYKLHRVKLSGIEFHALLPSPQSVSGGQYNKTQKRYLVEVYIMAYVNSGIEMKTTQYDWRIIGIIVTVFIITLVLVVMKFIYPGVTPDKMLSSLSAAYHSVNEQPVTTPSSGKRQASRSASPVIPSEKTAMTKSNTTVHLQAEKIPSGAVSSVTMPHDAPQQANEPSVGTQHHPAVSPESVKESQMVCSAEDRAAELCH